jgi:putative transposase
VCRVLQVSPSGFYAWREQGPSARAQRDAELLASIKHFHQRSDGIYGVPRIWKDLREEADQQVGGKRIAGSRGPNTSSA